MTDGKGMQGTSSMWRLLQNFLNCSGYEQWFCWWEIQCWELGVEQKWKSKVEI